MLEVLCLILHFFNAYIDSLDLKFTIHAITETWLNDYNCDLFNLPGYDFIEEHRTEKKGGGIGLYVKHCIDHKERKDLNVFNDVES